MDAAAPVVVRADSRRIAQIVWNLVSNAVKFTDEGEIRVTVFSAGSNAHLVVEDTGRGIATEFLPHVWERFSQADSSSSRRHGGLGLGLALVKHLTEMHGGNVSAESDGIGKGSRFTIDLPLRQPELPHAGALAGAAAPDARR